MTGWNSAFCEINEINIHYLRTGGNKPTLVLLHGLTANGACWTHVAHFLEKEFDIIMPDARGHGKSSAPDIGYQYEDHANDIVELINTLQLSPTVLVGHSMGGMTAALAASRSPKLLRGLILADPTFLSPEMQWKVFDSDAAGQHWRMLSQSLEELMADLQSRHPNRSSEMIELITQARLQTCLEAFDILTPPNPDFKQLVSAIEVPSLLVTADQGVVSSDVAEELQRLNTGFQVEQLQEAGHGLHYDQPGRFAAIIESFIRSLKNGH